jgi:hypothetical protein
MAALATLCLVVMAVSAWEATTRARNIIVILRERLRAQDMPEIQLHQG